MKIHSQIRAEVLELLQQKLNEVEHYYNGRPAFINIDEEQLAIAVFIDEAFCHATTVCDEQWRAELNVAIYLKSVDDGENELDEIAQQVADCLQTAEFQSLNGLTLNAYSYEQDQQQRTWYVANVQFDIEYERQGAENDNKDNES